MPAPDAPGRTVEYLPVEYLVEHEHPDNPKDHADDLIDGSLSTFGYVELVTLDERTGLIISGHGRYRGIARARDEGRVPPQGVRVDDQDRWLVPVVRGWASKDDDHARATLVALNEIGPRGGYRPTELAELLDALPSPLLDVTGFDRNAVDDMLASFGPPPDLDDLADKLGEPDPSDFWPTLFLRVSPRTKERWSALLERSGGSPDQVLASLLDQSS